MIIGRQPDEARQSEDGLREVLAPKGWLKRVPFGQRKEQQPGDVPQTWADVSKAGRLFNYKPTISFKDGVTEFYNWQKAQLSFWSSVTLHCLLRRSR